MVQEPASTSRPLTVTRHNRRRYWSWPLQCKTPPTINTASRWRALLANALSFHRPRLYCVSGASTGPLAATRRMRSVPHRMESPSVAISAQARATASSKAGDQSHDGQYQEQDKRNLCKQAGRCRIAVFEIDQHGLGSFKLILRHRSGARGLPSGAFAGGLPDIRSKASRSFVSLSGHASMPALRMIAPRQPRACIERK